METNMLIQLLTILPIFVTKSTTSKVKMTNLNNYQNTCALIHQLSFEFWYIWYYKYMLNIFFHYLECSYIHPLAFDFILSSPINKCSLSNKFNNLTVSHFNMELLFGWVFSKQIIKASQNKLTPSFFNKPHAHYSSNDKKQY